MSHTPPLPLLQPEDRSAPGPHSGPVPAPAPTILHCSSSADFLAALPLLTGFTADDSLFVVFFSGRHAGRAMRIDLPDREDPHTIRPLLDLVSDRLSAVSRRDGRTAGAGIVICTTQTFADAGGTPHRRLAHRIERRLRRDGYPLRDLCCLAPDGWANYFDATTPSGGRPLREITDSDIHRNAIDQMRTDPNAPVPLREIGTLPSVEPERRRALAAALDGPHLPGPDEPSPLTPGSGSLTDEAAIRADAERFDERLDTAVPGTDAESARLLQALANPERWFVLFLTVLAPAAVVPDLCADLPGDNRQHLTLDIDAPGRPSPSSGWSVARMVTAMPAEALDFERLRIACRVVADLASAAPRRWRCGPLALLALLWWMRGLQSVAEEHLVALQSEPGSDSALARMVTRIVRDSAPPGW